MTESHDILFLHVSRTLPDSLTERRALVVALARVLPAEHPAQAALTGMISAFELQDKFQQQLPIQFTQGGAK